MSGLKSEFIIRKINSLLIAIIMLLLLWHGLISALCMAGLVPYSPDLIATGRRLFLFVSLHIILSLYLYFKDKRKRKKIRTYFNIQNETQLQLISGIWIIVFMFAHYLSYAVLPVGHTTEFNIAIIHFIIDNLLFIMIFIHLRVSIPRLLVSLGFLQDENSYDKFYANLKMVLIVFLIFFFIAELIFYII